MGVVTLANRVAEPTVPVAGLLLKNVAEGSVLKLNEDGSPVEFFVAKHNYEPSFNENGRTLLVRKKLAGKSKIVLGSGNAYADGSMDDWLNNEYKLRFDAAVQTAMDATFFYYTTKGGTNGSLGLLKRAVFLPSAVEVGATVEERINPEGEVLPIKALLREPALYNEAATAWWTRSPQANDSSAAWCVYKDGTKLQALDADNSNGARPCFTLPDTAIFNKETLLFEGVL